MVGNEGNTNNPITQEKQEFVVKTNENGSLYFDSDASDTTGNNRFILYEIKVKDKEEHFEYKPNELGNKKKRPTFIRYLHHQKEKAGDVETKIGLVFEDDCRILINLNTFKCSKRTRQNWFNSSKGNKITDITISKGFHSLHDILDNLFDFTNSYITVRADYKDLPSDINN